MAFLTLSFCLPTWPAAAEEAQLISAAWRHVASPDPSGGAENEALLQSAEFDRSDVGLIGLMLRCHKQRIEPVVVLLDPLPPGTPATITWSFQGGAQTFRSTPIPTGAGLPVPLADADVESLGGSGKGEVAISVSTKGADVKGVIDLEGVQTPLAALRRTCREQPVKSEPNP